MTNISIKNRFDISWKTFKLRDILSKNRLGGNYSNSTENTGLPLIKMGNLGRGYISLKKIEYISKTETIEPKDILQKGDLLFNTRNTLELVGKVSIWNSELNKALYNSNLMKLDFNSLVESTRFMNYLFNSIESKRQLFKIATGTTSVAAIYTKDLLSIKFKLPPLPEQKKIAEILSTWDEAIETTQNLITHLELRKKGLMQDLLTGKKRLPGFSGDWKKVQIGEIADQYSVKNKLNEPIEVLSCTKYDGLVPSLQYFGRKVYGDDISKYKIVPKDYFAYATNHIEEGSIGLQTILDRGLVSPMYTVFKANEKVDNSFLFKLLKTERMIYMYQCNMSGSVARRGGLRWNVFETIDVSIPDIKEQKAISNLLDINNEYIEKQENKLIQLKTQKKGLMQQLLTGQKRVKVES